MSEHRKATARRGDRWGDRRKIPRRLLGSQGEHIRPRQAARMWINGRNVDPDPRFTHLYRLRD